MVSRQGACSLKIIYCRWLLAENPTGAICSPFTPILLSAVFAVKHPLDDLTDSSRLSVVTGTRVGIRVWVADGTHLRCYPPTASRRSLSSFPVCFFFLPGLFFSVLPGQLFQSFPA